MGEKVRGRLGQSVRNTSLDGIRKKLGYVFFDDSLVSEDLCQEEFRINNSPGAGEAAERLSEYFRDRIDDDVIGPELARRASELTVLLVWGENDVSVPSSVGFAAQQLLGDVPLRVIPEAGHAPYLEKPDEFNGIVRDFFAGAMGATA
jgi:pimeloyl-ACP methyl ester carboxylesterase